MGRTVCVPYRRGPIFSNVTQKVRIMPANRKVLMLPGDGIGPEVMRQLRRVVDWFDQRRAVRFAVKEGLVGGAAYDKEGAPISEATMADAQASDAVLFGAVGGPKWD